MNHQTSLLVDVVSFMELADKEVYINAELAAIATEKFAVNDSASLLERSGKLLLDIEALPDYLDEWTEVYVKAAAAHIRLLTLAIRYVDAVTFTDLVFDRLRGIDYTGCSGESISKLSRAMSSVAFCYAQVGNRKQAFETLHFASILLESIDENRATVRFYISLSAIYDTLSSTENRGNAVEYGLKAVQLSQQENLHNYIPKALVNLMHFLNVAKEYDCAIRHGHDLIGYLEETGQDHHYTQNSKFSRAYATGHTNLGDAWLGKGELEKADYYYNKALTIGKRYGPFPRNDIAGTQGLGSVRLEAGNYDEAIAHFHTAVKLGDLPAHKATLKTSYKLLWQAYEAKGDYKRALQYSNLFHEHTELQSGESAAVNYEVVETKYRLTTSIAHNEQLRENNLREQKLNQALAEKNAELKIYTNIIGHDLKSPLQSIMGSAELIEANAQSVEAVKNYSHRIISAAVNMGKLLDDLLLYSSTDIEVRPELNSVDLNKIVDDVVTDLQGKINENKVELDITSLPVVSGDETLLKAVFQNLIVNALKFQPKNTPEHVPRVKISTTATGQDKHVILVEDNGIGIPKEFADCLFKPFKRFHTAGYDGTGLGLSICKRVMLIHNADIELQPSTEMGSCFQLTFH